MALETQLLDTYNGIGHAKGALIQVIGGEDMTLQEVADAGSVVGEYLSPEAKMIWGAVVEPNYTGHIRTMVALTGVESAFLAPKPVAPAPEPIKTEPKKKGFFSV
jgi:cell division protein FtsZ